LPSIDRFDLRAAGPSRLAAAALRFVLGHRRLASVARASAVFVAAGLVGGCASLDARPDIQRSAVEVERAVGASSELLLRDEAPAGEAIERLRADGLTANEAVQVALLNNPTVRAAMLSIGVSRAEFVQSTLFSNPTLFLSLRFPDGGGNPNVELNLAQNFAELWLVPARKEAAQRDLNRVVLDAARTTASVVLAVRQAYVRASAAKAQVELAKQGREISTELLKMAELRREAGSGSEVDVNLARAARLQALADQRLARLAAMEAKAALCRLLGLTDDPGDVVLTDALQSAGDWNLSAKHLQATARRARLDLRIMDEAVASAEALARLERHRFIRSIDVGFAFELMERRSRGDRDWLEETFYDSLQSGAPAPPSLMPRESQGTDTITGPSFSVELPLWDQNQAQIAKADRLLQQARQWRQAVLVAVAQDIYSSLARVRIASENAAFYGREFVPTAERSVTLAQEGYRVGHVPFLSLRQAQRDYLATRTRQLQALEAAALAAIELERATGRPVDVLRKESLIENRTPEATSLSPATGERVP